jgi:hypothetical protein
MPNEYIDCVLTISAHDRATFEFLKDMKFSGRPNLAPETLSPLLLAAELDARGYGKTLFDALFPSGDNLNAGYRLALALARLRGQSLRLRLQIDTNAPEDLYRLNWERLYDEKEKSTLSRSSETVFSRLPLLGREQKPLTDERRKLLVVVSSPSDSARLGLDSIDAPVVKQEIRDALIPLAATVDVEFLEGAATPVRIREKLKENFHALHIQAHGMMHEDRVMSRLVLETEDGKAAPVSDNFFAELFDGLTALRMVTLVACHSGAQTGEDPFGGLALALVQQNLPVVIAMQQPISFEAAQDFNKYFYGELAKHGLVDAAINEARLKLRLSSTEVSDDWSAPVLFMRLDDGIIWQSAAAVAPATVAAVAEEEDLFWQPIVDAFHGGTLVPIIGSDINQGLLPSNTDVAALWTQYYEYRKYNYPGNNRNDLPRISRFIEARSRSLKAPHSRLLTLYKDEMLERVKKEERAKYKNAPLTDVITDLARDYFEIDHEAPHRVLADLKNISVYLTTTPDNFMAEALTYRGRTPRRVPILWQEGDAEPAEYQMLDGTPEKPLVWHLYGFAPKSSSLVLTEDDHLDFLRFISRDAWRLPAKLRSTLTEATLLFLGFNLRDLDFRILFKGVISQIQPRAGRVAVLQIQPDKSHEEKMEDLQFIKSFLAEDSKYLQIDIRWLSVRNFLVQLRDKI